MNRASTQTTPVRLLRNGNRLPSSIKKSTARPDEIEDTGQAREVCHESCDGQAGQHIDVASSRSPFWWKAALVVAAVCSVAGALVVFTLWHTFHAVHADYACSTAACEEVNRRLLDYADNTVHPCDDFYSHVCGHWLRRDDHPSTFMLDAASMFVEKRHHLLSVGVKSSDPNNHLLETARAYYVSCLKFFENSVDIKKTVHEVVTELEVPLEKWLEENSWLELFTQGFNLSFVNHFHNFLKINRYVTVSEGIHFVIERGRSFYKQMGKEDPSTETTEYLRRVIYSIGERAPNDTVIYEVIEIDNAWKGRKVPNGVPITPNTIQDLSCGHFTPHIWITHFGEHGGSSNTVVKAPEFGLVCADLESALINATSVARSVYLVALLVAHVLSYDFKLTASRTNANLQTSCLNSAVMVFKEMWLHALSMIFSIKKPVIERFKNYTSFKTMLRRVFKSHSWMGFTDREASHRKIENFTIDIFPSSAMSLLELECSRFGRRRLLETNSFIENYVQVYQLESHPACFPRSSESFMQKYKNFMGTVVLVDKSRKDILLPQFLGTEPIYYTSVTEDYINIATVTTMVLRRVARMANARYENIPDQNDLHYSWSERTVRAYQDIAHCLADRYKISGSRLSDEELDDAFSVMDAIEAARDTKTDFEANAGKEDAGRVRATDALFFRRACLPLCGSVNATPGPNDLSHSAAHAGCNFGVAKLPEFHRAFSCTSGHRMSPIIECFR